MHHNNHLQQVIWIHFLPLLETFFTISFFEFADNLMQSAPVPAPVSMNTEQPGMGTPVQTAPAAVENPSQLLPQSMNQPQQMQTPPPPQTSKGNILIELP